MQKFRVEITATAQSDIKEIFQQAAANLVLEIEKQIDSLEKFSTRCPVIPDPLNWVSNTGISLMATTKPFPELNPPE